MEYAKLIEKMTETKETVNTAILEIIELQNKVKSLEAKNKRLEQARETGTTICKEIKDMMSKAELEVLVEKYEGKANRAFRNFQETRISRYDRERRNAEELAGAIRMAVRASDDYTTMIHLRADLAEAAHLARAARMESEEKRQEAMEKALETVERMAVRRGILRGE